VVAAVAVLQAVAAVVAVVAPALASPAPSVDRRSTQAKKPNRKDKAKNLTPHLCGCCFSNSGRMI